nr:SNF2 helicase-associated domain-containing protein [Paenibacillus sp. YPD9-1]
MIETSRLTVHLSSMPSGNLFIWGARDNGGVWDALDLKHLLFAWHRASFYGTFYEPSEWQHREGIELQPLEALDYFSSPRAAQHLDLEWAQECKDLMLLAPAVKEALAEGRFMPDYDKWKTGQIGWKLQLPEELQYLETPTNLAWIHSLIPEWVESDGLMKDNLRQLETAYPLMRRGELSADLWLDEEDWLVAIGWRQDRSPMRTCLQLVEPDLARSTPGWQLRVVLQDRLAPDVLRTVTPQGEPAAGELPLPQAWQPELGRVERDAAKCLRILPWLDAGDGTLRQQLTEEEAWRFLAEGSVRLVEAGTSVFLPAWWDRIRKLKPRLRAKIKSSRRRSPGDDVWARPADAVRLEAGLR